MSSPLFKMIQVRQVANFAVFGCNTSEFIFAGSAYMIRFTSLELKLLLNYIQLFQFETNQ